MLAIEPRSVDGADEELAPVGAGSGVGHGQDALPDVRQLKVLVVEFGAVDAFAPGAWWGITREKTIDRQQETTKRLACTDSSSRTTFTHVPLWFVKSPCADKRKSQHRPRTEYRGRVVRKDSET